jgi:uncharacterized Zn finger protein
MIDVRLRQSGYKRRRIKACDKCGALGQFIHIDKHFVKCERCGKLYPKNHKFKSMVE